MTIENPEILWILFALVPLVMLFVVEYLNTRAALDRLGGRWASEGARSVILLKWFLCMLLFCAFFILSVFALAGFRWGEQPVEQDRENNDIVFVVDVSRSMLAKDIEPSRLRRSAELIEGLLNELQGTRAALIAFRGKPVTVVPITEDLIAIENALRFLGPELTTNPGTDVEVALLAALAAFPSGSNRHQVIVLLSDGEGLSGNPIAPAVEAKRKGIPIIVVGLGTIEGSGVSLSDGTVLTDTGGNPVVTRLDAAMLEKVSQQSGGTYIDASEPGAFNRLSGEIKDIVQRREHEGFHLVPVNRDGLFIAIALLCLALYVVVRSLRWRDIW